MVLSQKSDVKLPRKISFEGKRSFRTCKNQQQTYMEGTKHTHGDADLLIALEPKHKNGPQDVAHGDPGQDSDKPEFSGPCQPVLPETEVGVHFRSRRIKRKCSQKKSGQIKKHSPLQDLLEGIPRERCITRQ